MFGGTADKILLHKQDISDHFVIKHRQMLEDARHPQASPSFYAKLRLRAVCSSNFEIEFHEVSSDRGRTSFPVPDSLSDDSYGRRWTLVRVISARKGGRFPFARWT